MHEDSALMESFKAGSHESFEKHIVKHSAKAISFAQRYINVPYLFVNNPYKVIASENTNITELLTVKSKGSAGKSDKSIGAFTCSSYLKLFV